MTSLRHLNLFSNTTLLTPAHEDDAHEESWEAPWDTKAAILLGQGLFITFLVAAILCVCGRKHYRRMNLIQIQELTTIRIQDYSNSVVDSAAPANAVAVNAEERETRLQRIRHLLVTPLRFVDDIVNAWASSPSTDFEYYDRILQRMEREKEARREGVEERTKRLMNAFVEGQCIWEIEDKHFIPPCSSKDPDSSLDEIAVVQMVETQADIESGLKEQIENIYSAFNEKIKGAISPIEYNTSDEKECGVAESEHELVAERFALDYESNNQETVNINASNKMTQTDLDGADKEVEPALSLESNSSEQVTNTARKALSAATAGETEAEVADVKNTFERNTAEQLKRSASFEGNEPSYLYLNISQSRIRATIKSTNISASASDPSFTTTDSNNHQRTIPNQCAICLCDYTKGDTIVLSSNNSCPHAFHQECIVEWLVKMQEGTPCPCCRQTFVELENREETRANRGREMTEEELGALRRHLQLGIQRGRAFNASVIRF